MLDKYIGKTLYGFCDGYFGRDSYSEKVIVYVGKNYIVIENAYGNPGVACFDDMCKEDICELIEEWMIEEEEK